MSVFARALTNEHDDATASALSPGLVGRVCQLARKRA